jgi:cytochrome b561
LHTALAYLLFATFLAHLGAALMHALVFKDGVFASMTVARTGSHHEDLNITRHAVPEP